MTNRHYARGRDFEYRVKKRLEEDGWLVLRTAGSHSPIDLLALKMGQVPLAIQCKSGKRAMSAKDKATLYRTAVMAGAYPVVYERGMKRSFVPRPDSLDLVHEEAARLNNDPNHLSGLRPMGTVREPDPQPTWPDITKYGS